MRKHRSRARGFTLVEVLVALVILGLGVASVLLSYSASLKLMKQARDRTVAALLARSKLEETMAAGNADVVGDNEEEVYNGVPYAYRITSTPMPLVNKTVASHFKGLPKIEEIRVEVFWGDEGKQQRYVLVSYHRVAEPPSPGANAPNATPNANPDNGGGVNSFQGGNSSPGGNAFQPSNPTPPAGNPFQ